VTRLRAFFPLFKDTSDKYPTLFGKHFQPNPILALKAEVKTTPWGKANPLRYY
jgi:hypothetical protein